MGFVKFNTMTAASYAALSNKDNDTLYFITDTHKIFKGSQEYCPQSSESGAMIIKGTLTATTGTGVISRPASFKKGDVYILPNGTFENMRVAEGDLAIALYNFEDVDSGTGFDGGTDRGGDVFAIYKAAKNIHETVWE